MRMLLIRIWTPSTHPRPQPPSNYTRRHEICQYVFILIYTITNYDNIHTMKQNNKELLQLWIMCFIMFFTFAGMPLLHWLFS